ncbi:MAG: ATP-binding cassette domain-containing protein [bacterium]|nr:ATP-binding cassette domain-containing protein [bacterium]MDE0290440.1 ATP-binding cassette domain-containing protein [bacterium]MDE0437798.1 ATP-binding cassette domain-containing protein [bacterium]
MTPLGGAGPNPDYESENILEVRNLKKHFPIRVGFASRVAGHVRAVDGISFDVRRGETLALVGESGSGKTTTVRCIVRALDPTGGEIRFRTDSGSWIELCDLSRRELRPLRPQMQMVFQDPRSSLNPRMTVLDIIGEPLLLNGMDNRSDRIDRVEELLRLVRLRPEYMRRFPHAFSGGQRQRIGIARALALNPRLVIADEPVSALDVSVQAQTLNLLLELQEQLGLTYIFVAHDLSVVKHISDRVAVMYVGKIVEIGERDDVFFDPKHPYTAALLNSVPRTDPRSRRTRIPLRGEVADPANPPPGCHFHPRCAHAIERCRTETPAAEVLDRGRRVECLRVTELDLPGVGTG